MMDDNDDQPGSQKGKHNENLTSLPSIITILLLSFIRNPRNKFSNIFPSRTIPSLFSLHSFFTWPRRYPLFSLPVRDMTWLIDP